MFWYSFLVSLYFKLSQLEGVVPFMHVKTIEVGNSQLPSRALKWKRIRLQVSMFTWKETWKILVVMK